ncbi:MAG: hypothetical protein WAL30_06275 [Candidatus Aquirickettsiella sp.]
MEKSTNLEKRILDNSSSENTTQKLSTETSVKSFKKSTPTQGNFFFGIFQKLSCSYQRLQDDEGERILISKSTPK